MTEKEKVSFLKSLFYGEIVDAFERAPQSERYREFLHLADERYKKLEGKLTPESVELLEEYQNAKAIVHEEVMFYMFLQGWNMCSQFANATALTK